MKSRDVFETGTKKPQMTVWNFCLKAEGAWELCASESHFYFCLLLWGPWKSSVWEETFLPVPRASHQSNPRIIMSIKSNIPIVLGWGHEILYYFSVQSRTHGAFVSNTLAGEQQPAKHFSWTTSCFTQSKEGRKRRRKQMSPGIIWFCPWPQFSAFTIHPFLILCLSH